MFLNYNIKSNSASESLEFFSIANDVMNNILYCSYQFECKLSANRTITIVVLY